MKRTDGKKGDVMSQVIIITGGAGGIGSSLCRAFVNGGHNVVIADIDREAADHLTAEIGKGVLSHPVDVGNREGVNRMVEETVRRFGRIDVLLNGAGIMPRHPVKDISEEEWDRVLAINLKGVFLCSQAAARHMAARKQGRIISIVSGRGVTGAANAAHYAASKGGVIAFTKSLALELAPDNVLVNAIAPGAADTPMSNIYLSDSELQRRRTLSPLLGGYTRIDDIVGLVSYLISDAIKNVTGQVFFLKNP